MSTTAEQRESACEAFLEENVLAYIRKGTEEDCGSVLLLFESDGEPVAMSRAGEWPLRSYAANHGLVILSVH